MEQINDKRSWHTRFYAVYKSREVIVFARSEAEARQVATEYFKVKNRYKKELIIHDKAPANRPRS